MSHFTDINNKLCLYSSKNWKKILLATIEENLNFIVQVVHLMKTWKEEIGEKRVTPAERYHAMEDSYNNGGNEHDSKIQQIRLWEINMNNIITVRFRFIVKIAMLCVYGYYAMFIRLWNTS